MAIQLAFNFNNKPFVEDNLIPRKDAWLAVSDIARGVGFTETVYVSIPLHEALEHRSKAKEIDYDQWLYDALWLAHFKLSLDGLTYATFNFIAEQKGPESVIAMSFHLRLRVQSQNQTVWVGLLEDF